MAAVLGADEASARALCDARTADNGRLDVANINAPGQVVVAGGKADIEWLVDNAKGSRVSGVRYHSRLPAPSTRGSWNLP